MHIDKHERRDHITANDSSEAFGYWLARDLGPGVKRFKNIRPCGVDIGTCWVVTYEIDDQRAGDR